MLKILVLILFSVSVPSYSNNKFGLKLLSSLKELNSSDESLACNLKNFDKDKENLFIFDGTMTYASKENLLLFRAIERSAHLSDTKKQRLSFLSSYFNDLPNGFWNFEAGIFSSLFSHYFGVDRSKSMLNARKPLYFLQDNNYLDSQEKFSNLVEQWSFEKLCPQIKFSDGYTADLYDYIVTGKDRIELCEGTIDHYEKYLDQRILIEEDPFKYAKLILNFNANIAEHHKYTSLGESESRKSVRVRIYEDLFRLIKKYNIFYFPQQSGNLKALDCMVSINKTKNINLSDISVIGYSWGAVEALKFVRILNTTNAELRKVITIDPVKKGIGILDSVMNNSSQLQGFEGIEAEKFYNFYQSNDFSLSKIGNVCREIDFSLLLNGSPIKSDTCQNIRTDKGDHVKLPYIFRDKIMELLFD